MSACLGQRCTASSTLGRNSSGGFSCKDARQGWTNLGIGNFTVVWDGPVAGTFGQRYNAAGQPVGGIFRIDSSSEWSYMPVIADDAAGARPVIVETFRCSV